MADAITRTEMYLSAIAGDDITPPAPITRIEQYLQAIYDSGGASGSGVLTASSDGQGTITLKIRGEENNG